MENEKVVNTPLTTEQAEEAKPESETKEEVKDTVSNSEPEEVVTLAGDKTPPNELLGNLQKERERRRESEARQLELEEKIKQLEESSTSSEDVYYSDGEKALKSEITGLKSDLAKINRDAAESKLKLSNPTISEHWNEFVEYQTDPDNKGMNLNTAAKAFLADKGLVSVARKGLEKSTGGEGKPASVGKISGADAELLRKTNYKKYLEMIRNDQIQID